jgi:predicted DNA-binding protein (MmcQ/YjbR family)
MAHPRRPNSKPAVLARARKLCLGLPKATEKEAWGGPTFRVRNKMFAMYLDDHHGDGRIALWIKAPDDAQELLVRADPKRFFVPPYVGSNGWVGAVLHPKPDWDQLSELLEEGYRMVAGKRLCAELDGGR